jgi:hypothetical protein
MFTLFLLLQNGEVVKICNSDSCIGRNRTACNQLKRVPQRNISFSDNQNFKNHVSIPIIYRVLWGGRDNNYYVWMLMRCLWDTLYIIAHNENGIKLPLAPGLCTLDPRPPINTSRYFLPHMSGGMAFFVKKKINPRRGDTIFLA